MPFAVLLSEDAGRDIEDVWRYVTERDGADVAGRMLEGLEEACRSLAEFPERGNVPKELQALGIADYREVHFKPYRIIYRVMGRRVIVYCVLDGRRDMQSLLLRRLMR